MKDTILVRGARQLLTLRGPSGPRRGEALRDLGIIPDGALLIHNGTILDVGPGHRIENLSAARDAREINAAGRVVMPGFVDSHTPLVFGASRLDDFEMRIAGATREEIAAEGGGIQSSVRTLRATPAKRLERRARSVVSNMARHGTTTVEAKSGYGLDENGEWKMLRVLESLQRKPLDVIPTYLGAHAIPPEYRDNLDDYIAWMCSGLMPRIRRRGMAVFADVFCDREAYSLVQSRRYLEEARMLGFLLKVHAEQFSHSGATRLGIELEAVSVDHLDHVDSEDIRLLARSATMASLLPGSVFHLGLERYAPARMLIDEGAAVALATGFNPGTSPSYNMQMVLSLACAQMRMTPAEAVSAATINGAYAARCADRAGSLEPGKPADLIMLDLADYRELPYYFGVNHVHMTMKRGVIIYQEGSVASCPEP